MTPRARKVLAALVCAMGLFNAALAYLFISVGESFTLPLLAAAAVLTVPAIITIVWLLRSDSRRPVGIAAGLGVVNALESLSLGGMLAIGAWNPGDAQGVMTATAVMVLPNLFVALVAIVMAFRAYGASAMGDIVVGFGIALVMDSVAGFVGFAVSTAIDIGATLQWASRETRLTQAVTHVQSCAIRYAEQNPQRGYPDRYDDMGPAGSRCLDNEWLGKARKMHVRYVPERAGDDGAIASFTVYGRTPVANGRDVRASADTGGTVVTSDFVEGDELAPPRGPERTVWRLAWLRNCALLAKNRDRSSALPENLDALLRIGRTHGEFELLLGCYYRGDAPLPKSPDAVDYEGHRITYRPERGANGGVEHFVIEARPVTYGATAINSYLLRDTGAVHRTRNDRAATTADPVIPACTFADSMRTTPQLCVELARPKLSLPVAFLHPTEIDAASRLDIVARSAADTTQPPDPALWIGFSCEADSAHMAYMQPPPVSRRLTHQCDLSYWHAAKFPVLMFVRDSLGSVGWRLDTITVKPAP